MSAKRLSLLIVLVIGVVLAVFPFATGLFSKTHGVEQLTGDLRTTFTDKSLHQTRSDLDGVVAMANQLQSQTLPALPDALGMSNEQFQALLTTSYPDVAKGVGQLPTILPRFETLVSGLESQQSNFKKADSIPTGFLPSTVLPWLLLVIGIALAALAGRGLMREKAEGDSAAGQALAGSLVVGIVLAAVSVVFSIHAKGAAVDSLTTNLKPFFTQAGADKTRADMNTVQSMADQLTSETLPGLAKALGMTGPQFNQYMATNFPDVAKGVAELNTVLPRFQADVTTISKNVGSFQKTADIPTARMPATSVFWWLFLPGLVLIVVPVAASRKGVGRRAGEPSGSQSDSTRRLARSVR